MYFSSLFVFAISALLVVCLGQAPAPSPFDLDAEVESLKSRVRTSGCNPRVCFALDGSGSISDDDFTAQKNFVLLVASIIAVDPRARFAAVQYGLALSQISPITKKIEEFLLDVNDEEQLNAPTTFIASGLGYCISQLDKQPTAPAKIVLLGDGRSNFGGDPRPIARNWLFKDPSNTICAVGVGFSSTKLLRRITNSKNRVITVDEWDRVVRIMRRLVEDVCGLPAVF